MKTLCLFILSFLMLYNPKIEASIMIHPMESDETTLDRIKVENKNPLKDIDQNLESFVEVVRLSKSFQAYNIDLTNKLMEKVRNHNTLSGDDLYLIRRTFEMFYKLNMKIMDFGNLYEFRAASMADTFTAKNINVPMAKAHFIWLTANVVMMDHLEAVHRVLYLTDGAFRRIFKNSVDADDLTDADKLLMKLLTNQINTLTETLESRKFAQQIILVRSIAPEIKQIIPNETSALILLDEISVNKISTDVAKGRTSFKLASSAIGDAIIGIFNKLTNFLSGLFGNIAGNIKWRKGFLFDDKTATELAKAALRPMDIILEKSPFVLTDKLIPGHYGHVAIYLGTKAQLESIGMWNHPGIVPYHNDIIQGNTILEAVRPGVRLTSVEAFLNIDEYSIVRKVDGLESETKVSEQVTRGMEQIGKEYDFNFDISTLNKIVCSELIYIVFGHVTWPTQYRFGRPTITPDDVGEILFQKNTRFQMMDYVLSTKRYEIRKADVNRLADIYEYEKRASTGEPVKDPKDPTNSFWKKETKCYIVPESNGENTRTCKTTYKEYYYEEAAASR